MERHDQASKAASAANSTPEESDVPGISHDLPVVPDVAFTYGEAASAAGSTQVPSSATWKHFFLAAVHNTVTGFHQGARSIALELRSLVFW